MTLYSFAPRDPLVVRDGRPNDGRSESRSLAFPLPSVVAGVVRTQLGQRGGVFDPSLVPALLNHVHIRGPWLRSGGDLLIPAPLDALVTRASGLRIRALRPIDAPEGAFCSHKGTLVGLPAGEFTAEKRHKNTPSFWRWKALEQWLRGSKTIENADAHELLSGGIVGLQREERMHVAIGTLSTSEDGGLFLTEGLRARAQVWHADERRSETDVEFEVEVHVDEPQLSGRLTGLRPMAGERRLVRWSETHGARPELPGWLAEKVCTDSAALVRVLLVTPAFFTNSLSPACFTRPGVEVVATRVDRPLTVSGWDLSAGHGRGKPKRTRHLAAPGSVYWLKLTGTADEKRRWLTETWFKNVGDDAQLCRDGFGLAVVGMGGAE